MTLIEKNGALTVGYGPIDNDHDEFISLLKQLEAAADEDFPALFRQLYDHTQRHFGHENQLMQDCAFPAETVHKDEHERLLGEFTQFKALVDKGLLAFGRTFVDERLPQWFWWHAMTMDSALAAYLKMQSQA